MQRFGIVRLLAVAFAFAACASLAHAQTSETRSALEAQTKNCIVFNTTGEITPGCVLNLYLNVIASEVTQADIANILNGVGIPVANGPASALTFTAPATGIMTFLAAPTSANLAAAMTDETGTAGHLVFSVSPALTGSPTAPTQTTSDTSTDIATDAFAHNVVGAALPSATTAQLYGGTGAAGAAGAVVVGSGLSLTGGTLSVAAGGPYLPLTGGTIIPTSGTTNPGVNISQVGPTSGTASSPLYFNDINITYGGTVSSGSISGLQVNLNPTASFLNDAPGETDALSAGYVPTASNSSTGDQVAISGGFYEAYSTLGNLYGIAGGGTCATGCSTPSILGIESDLSVTGTGSAGSRIAFNANNEGTAQATTLDAAFGITANSAATTGGAFQNGIFISGNTALSSTGNLIYATYTGNIANIIYAPNLTVTGDIIDLPNFIVQGTGFVISQSVRMYGSTSTQCSSGQGVCYGGTVDATASDCSAPTGGICVQIYWNGAYHYLLGK